MHYYDDDLSLYDVVLMVGSNVAKPNLLSTLITISSEQRVIESGVVTVVRLDLHSIRCRYSLICLLCLKCFFACSASNQVTV